MSFLDDAIARGKQARKHAIRKAAKGLVKGVVMTPKVINDGISLTVGTVALGAEKIIDEVKKSFTEEENEQEGGR